MAKRNKAKDNSNKGRMVEELAARLYRNTGVKVETRVWLRPQGRPNNREREIDILLSPGPEAAGREGVFAIECKNLTKPISADLIDAFCGKLTYLGIPPRNGIFVSRSRFSSGALERAEHDQIRTYRLQGLRDDGLTLTVTQAFQSTVYLLLSTGHVRLKVTAPGRSRSEDFKPVFYDDQGTVVGMAYDLAQHSWVKGELPTELGEFEFDLEVPPNWSVYPDGKPDHTELTMSGRVHAIVISVAGQLTRNLLVNQQTGRADLGELHATWRRPDHAVTIRTFAHREELEAHLNTMREFHVVVREVLLPRIEVGSVWGRLYWPPSLATAQLVYERAVTGTEDDSGENMEGTEFARLFDEPWEGNPGTRNLNQL